MATRKILYISLTFSSLKSSIFFLVLYIFRNLICINNIARFRLRDIDFQDKNKPYSRLIIDIGKARPVVLIKTAGWRLETIS
ncbi:hypothetical protein HZS_1014 [Henneguya salminicola]|nr:hypothetical protein HZS_1014 [Henneguya salminicola]